MIDHLHKLLGLFRPADDDTALLIERRVLIAKFVVMFERIWRALLWPFVLTGGFAFVSILGLWEAVPGWAHGSGLLAYAAALIALLVPLARVRWPDRTQALRRLERDSGRRHRPASSYDDTPVQSDSPESKTFWRLHRERMAALARTLKPKLPSPRLDRVDPFALRVLVVLLLITAGIAVGKGAWDRLVGAVSIDSAGSAERYRLHAWVTPPIYTGLPPIVLADGQAPNSADDGTAAAHSIPQDSVLLVRVNGAPAARPRLAYSEAETRNRQPLEAGVSEGQMAEFTLKLSNSGRLDILDSGRVRTSWDFDVTPDLAPKIRLLEKPDTTPRGALRLAYGVEDDYGVDRAEARFGLAKDEAAGPKRREGSETARKDTENHAVEEDVLIKPPVIALRLPKVNTTSGDGRTFKDLTSHPWAGLRVRMILVALDQGGKEGYSKPVEFTLPQRSFNKPLARAIIEQRGNLVVSRDARSDVAEAIDGLTIAPDRFIDDNSVYLALRSAYWRLSHRDDDDALISVVNQLWDVAVHIEDGDLSDAERALQVAQDRLMQAIQDGASDEQIKQLVAELRAALGQYLKALAQNARERGMTAIQPNSPDGRMLSGKDIDELLRKIEDLAKTGSRELAQRLLSDLRDILERLQVGMMGQDVKRDQMMKAVEGLGEIIMQQQKLLDETFDMKRQQGEQLGQRDGQKGEGQGPKGKAGKGQKRGQAGQGSGGLAQRQGKLGDELGQLMEKLQALGAKPPNQLQGAGRAMGDAQSSLDEQALGRATQQQTLALDRLRQGAQSMAEQMMQMLSAQMGRPGQGPRDPLGRPERTQGPDLGTSVKVPDEIDIQRAREILDELRRRMSEPSRPLLELDYLERLIRNF